MDREIVVAFIAAGSAIIGAVLSFLTTYFTKIRELERVAQQKRDEASFEDLRHRIDTIYIPLNAAINKLSSQHDEFLKMKLFLSQNSSFEKGLEQLEEGAYKFKDACKECATSIRAPWDQGVDMYLTSELEWELNEFRNFLDHAEVRDPSFFRHEDFSIFIKQGYTFTSDTIPIISSIFDQQFKNYKIQFRALFRGVALGKTLRFYDDSIKKQVEDAKKDLIHIGYIGRF